MSERKTQAELAAVSHKERVLALDRFALLRPIVQDGAAVRQVARDANIPERTLHRWLAGYRRDGLIGLVRGTRADKGALKGHADLAAVIHALALKKPPPSAAVVHRQVLGIAAQQGWAKPSYAVVYKVMAHLNPGLKVMAHDSTKAYRNQFDLLHRREAQRPNDIWQADHTPLDIWVIGPDPDKPMRPWLTIIIDDHSRMVAGYVLGLDAPSALITSLALRQAIWRKSEPNWPICGIPGVFYTDHGSDFTSLHMEQVSADIKMQLVFSTVGMPRGRGRIERFFNTVNQLFLAHQPGYTPPGAAAAKAEITLAELGRRFHDFLLTTYHERIHTGIDETPRARWLRDGFLPRLPQSLEQLDLLLLYVAKSRKVRQDGIRFLGQRYIAPTLAGFVGESVTIRYEPRDIAELRVFEESGAFICRAICQELAGQTVTLQQIMAARDARRRALRAQINGHAALIAQYIEVHRTPEPARPEAPLAAVDAAPRLKRYFNE